MKLHVYLIQVLVAFVMIVIFPIYFAVSGGLPEAEINQVNIIKYKFEPQEITIPVGSTVRWVNQEKRQYHSVWFEQLGEPEPDYFFPGESYEKTFDTQGSFPYRCGPHPKMTGVVHVK